MKNQKGFAIFLVALFVLMAMLAIYGFYYYRFQRNVEITSELETSQKKSPSKEKYSVVEFTFPPGSQIDKTILGLSLCLGNTVDLHFLKEVAAEIYHNIMLLSVECWDIDWNRGVSRLRYIGYTSGVE